MGISARRRRRTDDFFFLLLFFLFFSLVLFNFIRTTEGVLRVAGKRSLERRSFVLFNEKHIFSQRNRFFFSPSSSSSSFSFSSPSSSSFSSFFRQHGNALFSKTPLSLALSYLSASSSSSSSHSLPVEKWPSLSLRRETSVSSSPSFRDKRRLKLFFLSSEKAFPSLFTSPFSRREEFSHLSSSSTSASPRRLLLSAPSLLASSPPISSSFSSSSSCGKISLPHRLHEDRNCRELSSFSSSSPSPLFSFSRFQSSLSSAALPFSSLRQFASKERQDQRNPVRKERRNVATCFAFGRDNPRSRPLHTSNSKVRRIEEEDREGGEGGEEEERRVRRKVRRVERRRLVQGLFSQRKRLLLEKRRRETGVYGGKVGKASDKEEEEEEIQGEEITKRKKKRKKKEEEIRVQGERGEEREERGGRRRISSSLHSPSVSVSSIPNSMTHNRVRHTPHADFLSLGKSKDVREEEEDEEKSRKGEKNAMESFLSSSSSSLGRKTPWLRVGLERKKREMKDESGPGEDRYEGEDRTEAKRQMEIANEREAKEEEERGELEGEKKEEEGGGELEISASTHSHRLIRHRDTFPRVCLLGRPNVGKSSLFNRLKREDRCASDSIVLDQEGTTRDRHYAFATWRERPFVVVDTGGLIFEEDRYAADLYADEIRIQVKEAVKETSCVLFLVDGRAGLDGEDEVIADFLRTCGKPVVVCVNKCENYQAGLAAAQEFWKLGLGQPFACSAVEGVGISDLLDRCFEYIPSIPFPSPPRQSLETSSSSSSSSSPSSPSSSSYRTSHTSPQPSIPPGTSPSQAPPLTSDGFLKEDINVAIIGRPNVGKSQLLNRLLGIPRSVVSPKAGTTRDAIDEIVERDRVVYRLVDTAGIRRARVVKAQKGTEYIMVKRAERALMRSDVCLFVCDAERGLVKQDVLLAKKIEEEGKGVVIIMNKWDRVHTAETSYPEVESYIRSVFYPIRWSSILYVSAKTGKNVLKVWMAINEASRQHRRRLTTGLLNFVLRDALAVHPPPVMKGRKRGKIYLAQQVSIQPPRMVVFCNKAEYFPDSYRLYLDFTLRTAFNFHYTPIKWTFREKKLRQIERSVSRQQRAST